MDTKLKIEKLILDKINKLPLEYKQELMDFIDYLLIKANNIKKNETLLLSEKSLAKDWLKPEEDEAWKDLWPT